MNIRHNISLKPFNTFGIDVDAKHFISVSSVNELSEALSLDEFPEKFILGGGSNMLLTKNIDALVIHVNLKGITIISETDEHVIVTANAGENWHEFVIWCIAHDFGGVENLSLIPGNVGTAPIQNIGAYGVELKDSFIECNAINCDDKALTNFKKEDCNFGYRDSIFKREAKGKYVITDVTFRLTKNQHKLDISYGAILSKLDKMGVSNPSIQDVSKAVIAIRQSKLPDPKELGNSGSFFKNPIITRTHFNKLKDNFSEIPSYVISDTQIKVPAGWLIEKAGFKGKRLGNFGVHEKQALVLVNYKDARGSDILGLSKLIQNTVLRLFDIKLEAEVNII